MVTTFLSWHQLYPSMTSWWARDINVRPFVWLKVSDMSWSSYSIVGNCSLPVRMCNRHHVVRCPIHRGHLDLTKEDRTWDPRVEPPVIYRVLECGLMCQSRAESGFSESFKKRLLPIGHRVMQKFDYRQWQSGASSRTNRCNSARRWRFHTFVGTRRRNHRLKPVVR